MTYQLWTPEHIDTTINLPASKSISNRALIIHALSGSTTLPDNLSDCDDTEVIIRALETMPETIDIKAAGTAMRFMTAYLSVTPGEHTLTGTERMQERPIGVLVDALRHLGADIEYVNKEGFPPLHIRGRQLEGRSITVDGSISSQYISALLMIGPILPNGLEMRLLGSIISRPYIDLTLCTMRDFGAEVDWTGPDTITVSAKPYQTNHYFIENDWSSASYWYEVAALHSNEENRISLQGLSDGSKQGDSTARYLFSLLGVKTIFEEASLGKPTTVHLKRQSAPVPRMEYNFINQPDLAQTFVVTCAMMDVPFHFKGLSTLKIKETDRIEALKTEMRKLGFVIHDVEGKELYWDGERCEPQNRPVINTYNDHRMAMAFAPASCIVPFLHIAHPEVVTKSYPLFWDDLRQAGFTINEMP
ncbi:MAG: 3-phosphoshikimate 1-carboxyvinyltransferase [Prevotella sp.]|nr:3-phosphoshikimate 1-carboxyvinyltransferase [Prevotella sp.]